MSLNETNDLPKSLAGDIEQQYWELGGVLWEFRQSFADTTYDLFEHVRVLNSQHLIHEALPVRVFDAEPESATRPPHKTSSTATVLPAI